MNSAHRIRIDDAALVHRKNRVIEAATTLFLNEGYGATTFVQIAKNSKVPLGTIYQQFGNKPNIFEDVIYAAEERARFPSPEVTPGQSLPDTLMQLARYALGWALRDQTTDLMRLLMTERDRFPELTKEIANTSFERLHSNIESVFRQLADEGPIREADHHQAAELFIDLILGQSPLRMCVGWLTEMATAEILRAKIELFISGRFGSSRSTARPREKNKEPRPWRTSMDTPS